MSAVSLMLSISFVEVIYAAETPINATLSGNAAAASTASEPSLTDSQGDTSKVDADKGAEAKTMLEEVVVTGKHEAADTKQVLSAETESTGSYNSNAVTIAGKVPLKRKEIANSVSVVTRKQMDDQNLITVSEALKQVPGVTLISNDTGQDQFAVRGGAPNVEFDGVPVYNGLSGYQQFDLAVYDRVEVLRGPTGLLDGSGSFSGTVNLVKKKPRKETAVSAAASLGTWNNKIAQLDATGSLNEAKTLRGRTVGSFQDRNYYFDRGHGHRALGLAELEYDFSPSTTGSFSYTAQKDANPEFSGIGNYTNTTLMNVPRSTNPNPSWQKDTWDTKELSLGLEHRFDGDWIAKVKTNRRDQQFHFVDAYPTVGVTPVTYNIATYNRRDATYWYTRNGLDADLSGSFELLGRTHKALVGYNYDWFRTTSSSRTAQTYSNVNLFNPDVIPQLTTPYTGGSESFTTQHGLFGNTRISVLDPLTLVLGGRYSTFNAMSRNIPPAAQTPWVQGLKVNNKFTSYGGLVYDVNKEINVYGSYSEIFVPQTQLLYGGGILPPKVGRQYEFGTKGEFFQGGLSASVAIFNIQDQGRAFSDPEHPNFYVALGKVESKGLELEASGSPLNGLDLTAGYTRQTTTNLVATSNVGLPINNWYPTHSLKLWSNYTVQGETLAGFNFGLGMNGESRTTSNCTGCKVLVQGGYAVWTAQAGYKFNKNTSANLVVENLFDRWYYTRIQGDNTYNVFGNPRNVMLTLRTNL
jgi:outer membrane receptor for ferric coprogen and ferric-rhodotorulic acid